MGFKLTLTAPKFNEQWWKSSKPELNRVVEEYNRESWSAQRDPVTDKKWAPRAEPTGSWPLLNKTGKMFGSTKFKSGKDPMSFLAKTVDYGKFHQSGTSRMPQRRWLGVGGKLTSKMAKIIAKKVIKGKVTFRAGS